MTRILIALSLLIGLALQARGAEPEASKRTGTTTLTFTEGSPLSTNAEICNRMRWPLQEKSEAQVNYKVSEESFEVYVPAGYTGEKAYGLLVFVNPHPSGRPPGQYLEALDKHRLIYVGANRTGNDRFVRQRMALALDGAANMKRRYNIDPERVYVSGISGGGRIASMLGVGFPDVFKGGVYIIGCNFYKTLKSTEHKVPGTDKLGFYTRSYDPPPAEFFRAARERSGHVLITGDSDENREQTWLNYQGFVRDRFEHVTYYQVPGMGHQPPPADWFDEALAFLDRREEVAAPQVAAAAAPKAVVKPAAVAAGGAAGGGAAAGGAAGASQGTDRAAVAAGLLTRAKLYVDNKVYEQARERLGWIVKNYPETPAAGEARRMLKEIEGAGK
jgi:hypothetical protein